MSDLIPHKYFITQCRHCGADNEVNEIEETAERKCFSCWKLLYEQKQKPMEIIINNISSFDDETLKDAFIHYYIDTEEINFYGDHNKLVEASNQIMITFIRSELEGRGIIISRLINRAIKIIDVNKLLKFRK